MKAKPHNTNSNKCWCNPKIISYKNSPIKLAKKVRNKLEKEAWKIICKDKRTEKEKQRLIEIESLIKLIESEAL